MRPACANVAAAAVPHRRCPRRSFVVADLPDPFAFFLPAPSSAPHPLLSPQRQVYAYAQGLLEGLGVKKGSKIAVWMTDELEHVVLQYAAGLVGATLVEIDPKLGFDAVL